MSSRSLGEANWGDGTTKSPYVVEALRAQFEQNPKFFININDDLPMDEAEEAQQGLSYAAALKAQTKVLEEYFPS